MPAVLTSESCIKADSPEESGSSFKDVKANAAVTPTSTSRSPIIVEQEPVDGLYNPNSNTPPLISVCTNTNGYWKQERLLSPQRIAPTSPKTKFCLTPEHSDSGNEDLIRKPQPFLDFRTHSSSEEENEHGQIANSSETNRKNIRMQGRSALTKGPHSLTAFIKQRSERARLYKQRRMEANVKKACNMVDERQPWAVGELLWARPGHPDPLPWWPAIVVQRPRKPITAMESNRSRLAVKESSVIPIFRIFLLGPLKSFNLRRLPQTRLRLFSGRAEFDSFLRQSVLQAENKVKALRQFVIPPSLQSAWQAAFDSAEAARVAEPDASGRLALFPWAAEQTFRQLFGVPSHLQQKKDKTGSQGTAREKNFAWITEDSSRSPPSSDSSFSDSGEHNQADASGIRRDKSNRDTKRVAESTTDSKKPAGFTLESLAARFEYEKLQFAHMVPGRVFVCIVCGKPGEHTSTNGLNGTHNETTGSKAKRPVDDGGIGSPAPHLHAPHQRETHYPDIRPCAGGCGNYLHPRCAQTVDLPPLHKPKAVAHSDDAPRGASGPQAQPPPPQSTCSVSGERVVEETPTPQIGYACKLCLLHLRRCFICSQTQSCPQLFTNATPTPGMTSSNSAVEESPLITADAQSSTEVVTHADNTAVCLADAEKQNATEQDLMIRCSVKTCSRWYHSSCLRKPPFSAVVRDRRAGAFACPAHACLACAVETPGTLPRPTPRYIRCLLCPAAYHPGDWCLPAGSRKIAHNWIICPRHALDGGLFTELPEPLRIPSLSPTLATMFQPTNVSWCFICSKGGRIICCETCPASFHEECLKIDEVPDKFVCEDCASGHLPRYGEIVWARLPPNSISCHARSLKCGLQENSCTQAAVDEYASMTAGMYWWPGEIVHPEHLALPNPTGDPPPDALIYETVDEISLQVAQERSHPLGLFPVRLFGLGTNSRDRGVLPIVVWSTRARLFPYEEGDDKRSVDSSSSDSTSDDEDELRGDRRRRRSSIQDDGEDEDPLLQLGRAVEKDQTTPDKEDDASGALTSPPSNIRLRSTRRQRVTPQNSASASKRRSKQNGAPTDPALVSQRKEVYNAAVKQAAAGYDERREKFNQLLGRTRRPDYYKPIKVNWPLGSVRIYRLTDPTEAPRCECVPNASNEPCGPSSNCINRELHYECTPTVCPNGEACQNQRFTKRLYPPQRPFWTGEERGWGLKTLVPISSGDFVNEYIGDLIDEEEANRRLRFAHENNVTNYYMMKLDSQRIIDAGPKGNLSRFMNHSCNPNLNTQKWTVNGDNRIGLFAVRDIAAGEELTFDYNFVALGQERLNCRCGASNCTGFLGSSGSSSVSQSNSNGNHANHRHTEDRADSTKHASGHTAEVVSKVAGSVGGHSRSIAPKESALVREKRHENKCYRCGSVEPPLKSGLDSAQSEDSRKSGTGPCKRRFDREVKELVSDSPSCSPATEGSSRVVKRRYSVKPEGDHSQRPGSDTIHENPLDEKHVMLFCMKSDCSKSYHLSCLNLEIPPTGRWYCPWHHCDACGRPSHVFCDLCPSSFCLAHVEGSITVIPPTARREVSLRIKSRVRNPKSGTNNGADKAVSWTCVMAKIVCMSHSSLVEDHNSFSSKQEHNAPDKSSGSLNALLHSFIPKDKPSDSPELHRGSVASSDRSTNAHLTSKRIKHTATLRLRFSKNNTGTRKLHLPVRRNP